MKKTKEQIPHLLKNGSWILEFSVAFESQYPELQKKQFLKFETVQGLGQLGRIIRKMNLHQGFPAAHQRRCIHDIGR